MYIVNIVLIIHFIEIYLFKIKHLSLVYNKFLLIRKLY